MVGVVCCGAWNRGRLFFIAAAPSMGWFRRWHILRTAGSQWQDPPQAKVVPECGGWARRSAGQMLGRKIQSPHKGLVWTCMKTESEWDMLAKNSFLFSLALHLWLFISHSASCPTQGVLLCGDVDTAK